MRDGNVFGCFVPLVLIWFSTVGFGAWMFGALWSSVFKALNQRTCPRIVKYSEYSCGKLPISMIYVYVSNTVIFHSYMVAIYVISQENSCRFSVLKAMPRQALPHLLGL